MYYVYIHTKSDMTPFYVGVARINESRSKGFCTTYERAHAFAKRPYYWKQIASQGYFISIYGTYQTLAEAHEIEKELILKYGRMEYDANGILCNRSVGGIDFNAKKIRQIPILQIDINTNEVIKEWRQPQDIETATGYLRTNIVKCCRKKQITAYGFKWQYKEDTFKHIDATAARKKTTNKGQVLLAHNLITNQTMEFRTQEECCKHTGVNRSLIHAILNKGKKHDVWSFKYKGWSLMR